METNTISSSAFTITREEREELWERRYNELMALSKEELVFKLIGRKEEICIGRIYI